MSEPVSWRRIWPRRFAEKIACSRIPRLPTSRPILRAAGFRRTLFHAQFRPLDFLRLILSGKAIGISSSRGRSLRFCVIFPDHPNRSASGEAFGFLLFCPLPGERGLHSPATVRNGKQEKFHIHSIAIPNGKVAGTIDETPFSLYVYGKLRKRMGEECRN